MRRLRTHGIVAALALLCAAIAACDSPGSSATGGGASLPPRASEAASTSGPVFHFQGGGQGGSPAFSIHATGTYTVTYQLSAASGGPACLMSIALSHESESAVVVDQLSVPPGATRSGTKEVRLAAGDWRAIEGGGCTWSLTVAG